MREYTRPVIGSGLADLGLSYADLGLSYVVGIVSTTSFCALGTGPLPPKAKGRRGRPATRLRRPPGQAPVSAKALAESPEKEAWQEITWREGTAEPLTSRAAIRDYQQRYGLTVDGKPSWQLLERLGREPGSEIWQAQDGWRRRWNSAFGRRAGGAAVGVDGCNL